MTGRWKAVLTYRGVAVDDVPQDADTLPAGSAALAVTILTGRAGDHPTTVGEWLTPEGLVILASWGHLDAGGARERYEQAKLMAAAVNAGPTVEHAIPMSDGNMYVRSRSTLVEERQPATEWVRDQQNQGTTICTRTVIIIKDWTEAPR